MLVCPVLINVLGVFAATFAERWRNRRQARRQGEEEDQGGSTE